MVRRLLYEPTDHVSQGGEWSALISRRLLRVDYMRRITLRFAQSGRTVRPELGCKSRHTRQAVAAVSFC